MNEKQIKQSKMQIQSLAELCINQIYENKFLEEKKTRFNEYLRFIKSILISEIVFHISDVLCVNILNVDGYVKYVSVINEAKYIYELLFLYRYIKLINT